MMKTMFWATLLACPLLALACDDDHDHEEGDSHGSSYPSCKAITDACHEVDVGVGEPNRCHELAHEAKSDAPCAAEKDACVATCKAAGADGGAAGDGG